LIIENEFLFDRKLLFNEMKYMIAIIDDTKEDEEDVLLDHL